MEEINNTSKLKPYKKNDKKNYQYIKELKQDLSEAKKFIEYFFIIGLDPKISLEEFLFDSSFEDLRNYYSKELRPGFIAKFPPIAKSYINIDENLSDLCFPDGFKIEKYEVQPEPDLLKFLLGNYFYSIDFPLKYITCLKIYENLEQYQKLQLKLRKNFGKSAFNLRKSSKNIIYIDSFKDDEYNTRNSITNTKSITVPFNYDNNKIKENDFHKYYFPKIIGFVSLKPFYKYEKEILLQIYNYYKKPIKYKIPLEKTILNILHNIPMPPKGLDIYRYRINESFGYIDIKSEKMNKLKNIDEDLIIIFKYFSIDNFIKIFKYVLYETKTIVFGTNVNHLCSFVYSLISILCPFSYPFQVSSCIHKNAFEVLESISPYIIGVNQKFNDLFFSNNKIEIKGSNYIIIDLDNKEFTMNIIDEVPHLPKTLYKKLKSKIENNLNKYVKNKIENNLKNNDCNNLDEKEENWICYSFFDFFLNALYNYADYLNNDNFKKNYKISSLKILFKLKEFIDSHSSNEREFYKKLVETQMFNDFIFKKMIPKDINDKLEILFFDEYINRKNNKKLFSKNKSVLFLNSKEYEYKEITNIPIINGLSLREKKRYIDKNYALSSLILGQEIVFEKNKNKNKNNNNNKIEENNKEFTNKEDIINNESNEDENGECYFNYILFPKFNKDFFNDPSPEYNLYTPIISDINRINTDLLAKSHISSKEMIENNEGMLDYIFLTYIEVWGYSYWYQDIIEREYRFEQMLEVLDKIKHHEIEIINVLFESLNKFQEKEKIIRLYDRILAYNITPNSFIYSIVGKIVQKRIENQDFMIEIKNIDKNNFPRRTFRAEDETNILGDSISFNYIQNCPDCNKLIDIENISREHKKMKKDLYWAKCPFCNYIKPQITVNFGNSISSKYSYFPCSKVETFTLCSPYELKNSLKDIIEKEKFHLLDIDKFKMKFPNLFWSCIWYFHLYNLDYNIILPYEVNIFKQKTNSNGINLHYINSKIYSNFKKNYNDIIIQDENINNNKKINLFVIQNIFSFVYINNTCYDYYGTFKKFKEDQFKNPLNHRRNTFIKKNINKKNTISGFLKSAEKKKLSNKKIDNYKTPNIPTKKPKPIQNININEIDEIILEKSISHDINLSNSINDSLNEINEIKPIKLSNKNNNRNNSPKDNKSSNSSSLSDN